MAITIDWPTKTFTVPQADLTLVSGTLYRMDTEVYFRSGVNTIMASEEGIVFDTPIDHNTSYTVVGVNYARKIEMINSYRVQFSPNAQWSAELFGSNNNIWDIGAGVLVQNQVQVIPTNSAGLANPASVSNIETDIAAIESNIALMQTDVSNIDTNVDTNTTTLSGIASDISTINTNIGTITTDIGTINASITSINGNISSIEGNVATIQTDIGNIETDITTINGNITTISGDIGTINLNISSIDSSITNIETDIATIQTDTADFKVSMRFMADMEGGRWMLDAVNNQMICFKSDNSTEIARFNTFDLSGTPSVSNITHRTRVL